MLPTYSPRERSIDGFIHGVGVSAAVIAVGVLLHAVIPGHDPLTIVAATVYAVGLISMLSLSAAYNLVRRPNWREAIRRYDHAAIFVMIAGTYTPFTLVSIGGSLGHGFLAVVWGVALLGLLLKLLRPGRFDRAAIVLYLALGWVGLLIAGSIIAAVPQTALILLAVGGVLYTAGVLFHLWRTLPHHNAIWHAFVLLAAGCHYVAVLKALAVS